MEEREKQISAVGGANKKRHCMTHKENINQPQRRRMEELGYKTLKFSEFSKWSNDFE